MNFLMVGAGYIGPRHAEAIKSVGGNLLAFTDRHDCVGWIDRYFPEAKYFQDFERFDRFVYKQLKLGVKVDYVSIITPSHLHDAGCRYALRIGADAICEKPLVISPWNLDQLKEIENEYNKRVYCVLQLRYHKSVLELKDKIDKEPNKRYKINLSYVTPRGFWYNASWKGDARRSGGVAMNIGIHFFDMLLWIFGDVKEVDFEYLTENTIKGSLVLEKADVDWFLSTEATYSKSGKPERSLTIDGDEFNFSDGFDSLHTRVYEDVLKGNGYGIDDSKKSLELTFKFRSSAISIQKQPVIP